MNKIMRVILIALLPLTSMGALTVNNGGGATNITATSAWITATVASTGAANPNLYSYWGTNSGGTNVNSWGHTNSYGVCTQASYSFQATGLSGSTIYYFRTRGTNVSETAWATYSAQFVTLTTPTSAPPSTTQAVTVDTNDVLKHPMNLFMANTGLLAAAVGTFSATNIPYGISASTAYRGDWGNNVSGRVVGIEGNTSKWEKAATDAVTATNAIPRITSLEGRTSTWDTVTGKVDRVDTNGWTVSAHSAWITNYTETDSIATNRIEILSNHVETVRADLTNRIELASNAFVAADTVVRSELTNTITVASNHFESVKLNTNGNGAGLTNVSIPSTNNIIASITNLQGQIDNGPLLTNQPNVAIGPNAVSDNTGIAIGESANAANDGVAIGYGVDGNTAGVGVGFLAMGYNYGVALGSGAGGVNKGVAVGCSAIGEQYSVAIGYKSWAYGSNSITIGTFAYTEYSNAVAIGFGVTNEEDNTMVINGRLNMRGDSITNAGNIYGNGAGITNITPAQVGAATTVQMAAVEGRTNVWNQAATDASAATNNISTNIISRIVGMEGQSNLWNTVNLSMTNYVHVPSSSNWLAYDPATRLFNGCVTNQGGGAGTYDYAALTNYFGNTNALPLTQAEKAFATNWFVMAGSTNIGFFVLGGTTYVYCSYSDASILAATQAINAVANAALPTNNAAYQNLLTNTASKLQGTTADAAVKRAGDIMTGPLTNTAGYYGNGAGLTNLTAPEATNALALGNIPSASWVASTQAINAVANAALPKAGGTMTGALTGTVLTANSYNFTNTTTMNCGTLNGTNGVYWTFNLTNYWMLLVP